MVAIPLTKNEIGNVGGADDGDCYCEGSEIPIKVSNKASCKTKCCEVAGSLTYKFVPLGKQPDKYKDIECPEKANNEGGLSWLTSFLMSVSNQSP